MLISYLISGCIKAPSAYSHIWGKILAFRPVEAEGGHMGLPLSLAVHGR